MHQEVQIASVRHHPWDGIHVSVHRQIDGEVRSDEWGSIGDPACSRSVDRKCTQLGLIEDIFPTLGDVEFLDEGLAEGPGELGAVRVVAELLNSIRIEEDVNVVRLKSLGSWLAGASLFTFHRVRVRIRQGEDGED